MCVLVSAHWVCSKNNVCFGFRALFCSGNNMFLFVGGIAKLSSSCVLNNFNRRCWCSSPTAPCSAVFAGEEHLQRRWLGTPTRAEQGQKLIAAGTPRRGKKN
jgi:hypothetical protein